MELSGIVAGLLSLSGPVDASSRTCGSSVLCTCRSSASVARLLAAASPTLGLVCTAMRKASLIVNGAALAPAPNTPRQLASNNDRTNPRLPIQSPLPDFPKGNNGISNQAVSNNMSLDKDYHRKVFSQQTPPYRARM